MEKYHTKYILGERGNENKLPHLLTDKKNRVTTIFRPGDRTNPHSNKYTHRNLDGFSFLGIIEIKGDDSLNTLPKYSHLFNVKIVERTCKSYKDLEIKDFFGAYPHIYNVTSLKKELFSIYGKIESEKITIYKLSYDFTES
ncbi:hypothetical protein [Aquimarina algicola]|uniref:Uncharacterized protein n=1 Tax=Aquimarina algicola TaxID=2589995 RepID=A0A504JR30_9FLAO|nr:hypothetical protein [Aquimarina algicola]TPN88800.1 hypothetical protein FHK87_00885 [Aquimarina algicola]